MKNLNFSGQNEDEPYVYGNYQTGELEIYGRFLCYTPTLTEFYFEVTGWIIKYLDNFYGRENPDAFETELTVKFALTYYDTAASKRLYMLFSFLSNYITHLQAKITVYWVYEIGDEDMYEGGKLYQEEFPNLIILRNIKGFDYKHIERITNNWSNHAQFKPNNHFFRRFW